MLTHNLRALFAAATIAAAVSLVVGAGIAVAPWITRVHSVDLEDQQIVFETSPGDAFGISIANAAIVGAAGGLLLVGGVVVFAFAAGGGGRGR